MSSILISPQNARFESKRPLSPPHTLFSMSSRSLARLIDIKINKNSIRFEVYKIFWWASHKETFNDLTTLTVLKGSDYAGKFLRQKFLSESF